MINKKNKSYKKSLFFLEKKFIENPKNVFYFFGKRENKVFIDLKKDGKNQNNFFCYLLQNEVDFLEKNYEIAEKREFSMDIWYKTKDFVEEVSVSKKYKNFERKNDFKILEKYEREKIKIFFEKWCKNLKEKKGIDSNVKIEDIFYILDNKKKYDARAIFLEIDGKLSGFSVGCAYEKNSDTFICLYNYGLKNPRDISLFLKVKRAEVFSDFPFMLDSVYLSEIAKSVKDFKLSLAKPYKKEINYFIKTGEEK